MIPNYRQGRLVSSGVPLTPPVPIFRRRGFTLLQLLMVVAIISLLIATLLPAMSKAREASRRMACLANLWHIGTAWHAYLDDHERRLFKGINANINYGGNQGEGAAAWGADRSMPVPKPLNRYMNMPEVAYTGADVFRCPSDEGSDNIRPSFFIHYGTSYQTNLMLIGQTQLLVSRADPCAPVLAKINARLPNHSISAETPDASRLILIGDLGGVNKVTPWDEQRLEFHKRRCSYNLAFLDGHGEFVRIRKGLFVADEYNVIPFQDLLQETQACQREVPCP